MQPGQAKPYYIMLCARRKGRPRMVCRDGSSRWERRSNDAVLAHTHRLPAARPSRSSSSSAASMICSAARTSQGTGACRSVNRVPPYLDYASATHKCPGCYQPTPHDVLAPCMDSRRRRF
eukprot:359371-Chlamydomonas_euryale.AAC.2